MCDHLDNISNGDEFTLKIINNLNKLYGKDLKNLSKVKDRVEVLTQYQKDLEKRVSSIRIILKFYNSIFT